jgi:hypothetical protein
MRFFELASQSATRPWRWRTSFRLNAEVILDTDFVGFQGSPSQQIRLAKLIAI